MVSRPASARELPASAPAVIRRGSYFTDERRLYRVEKADPKIVLCEDVRDPSVSIELTREAISKMRRVSPRKAGSRGG